MSNNASPINRRKSLPRSRVAPVSLITQSIVFLQGQLTDIGMRILWLSDVFPRLASILYLFACQPIYLLYLDGHLTASTIKYSATSFASRNNPSWFCARFLSENMINLYHLLFFCWENDHSSSNRAEWPGIDSPCGQGKLVFSTKRDGLWHYRDNID